MDGVDEQWTEWTELVETSGHCATFFAPKPAGAPSSLGGAIEHTFAIRRSGEDHLWAQARSCTRDALAIRRAVRGCSRELGASADFRLGK